MKWADDGLDPSFRMGYSRQRTERVLILGISDADGPHSSRYKVLDFCGAQVD
jgi:hypothetical protein